MSDNKHVCATAIDLAGKETNAHTDIMPCQPE